MVKVCLMIIVEDERQATQAYHICREFPSLPTAGLFISAGAFNFDMVIEQVEYCPFTNTVLAFLKDAHTEETLDEIDSKFEEAGWKHNFLRHVDMG